MATETELQIWWGGGVLLAEESHVRETKKYIEFSCSTSSSRDVPRSSTSSTQFSFIKGVPSSFKASVVPSKAHIKQHLKVFPNTSLFYSRIAKGAPSYKPVAKAWRDIHYPSLYVLEELWTNTQNWTQFYGYTGAASASDKDVFWARACRALAELASGRVFVVLGPGVTAPDWGDSETAWAKEEWPALKANKAVTEVVQVNPCTGSMTIIWARYTE